MDKSTTPCAHCGQPRTAHAPTCRHAKRIRTAEERFWLRVTKTTSCWLWKRCRSNGYGRFVGDDGIAVYAHRFSWELHYGTIPHDMWVLHCCDNPSCVRPDHLFLGTHDDNMADMAAKGRAARQQHPEKAPKGEQHGNAKLTDEDVRAIRQQRAHGVYVRTLAKQYGVCKTTIKLIVSRKAWSHVE